MPRFKTLAILPLAALAGTAQAYDPIVVEKGWPQLDYASDGPCEAEIRGNGKVFLINAVGLGAETPGRYIVTNEDMKPIDWQILTSPDGRWARYYVPFLPNLDAGTVQVTISTRQCSLDLSFNWDTYIPANDWASKRAMGG